MSEQDKMPESEKQGEARSWDQWTNAKGITASAAHWYGWTAGRDWVRTNELAAQTRRAERAEHDLTYLLAVAKEVGNGETSRSALRVAVDQIRQGVFYAAAHSAGAAQDDDITYSPVPGKRARAAAQDDEHQGGA